MVEQATLYYCDECSSSYYSWNQANNCEIECKSHIHTTLIKTTLIKTYYKEKPKRTHFTVSGTVNKDGTITESYLGITRWRI